MTIKRNQAIAVLSSTMIAATVFGFTPASAVPVSQSSQPTVGQDYVSQGHRGQFAAAPLSARLRQAAGAAAVLGIIGTAAAIAHAENRRDDRRYYRGARYRGAYCGYGPAGPIPPSGYWHYGTFYRC